MIAYFVITSGPIIALGRTVEIHGTYVIMIRNTNMMARNGNAARTTPIIDIPATPAVTNKFRPTGGVIIPISIFTTIMIPR